LHVDPHLPRRISGWYSPRLGMDMPIAVYGERGHPLLLLPTANSDFLETERQGLVKAIERHIFDGKCRVFCIESINRHAWMNESVPIPESARRQALYAAYIEEEVVPYIRDAVSAPGARVAVTGASFGAFHAANQLFRRPDLFDTLIAMSGFYDLDVDYTSGYVDDNVYRNNPVAYLSSMSDEQTLRLLRERCQIHIVTGRGRWELPQRSEQLSAVLHQRGIPHNLDLWGHDVDHQWPWWYRMLDHYLAERVRW
jgi:esterase/lipase superfamily enzyme